MFRMLEELYTAGKPKETHPHAYERSEKTSPSDLANSTKDHKGSQARNFQCSFCDARFARSDLRKRHTLNFHSSSSHPEQQNPASVPNSGSIANATTALPQPSPPVVVSPTLEPPVGLVTPGLKVGSYVPGTDPLSDTASDIASINAFYTAFLPSFPVIHRGTFEALSAESSMQNAIICIGALYCQRGAGSQPRIPLFESTCVAMQKYVEKNRSRYQQLWVLQTFLLLEFFGLFAGDHACFQRARRIHRDLVDAIRMLQMSHEGTNRSSIDDMIEEAEDETETSFLANLQSLETRWQEFAKRESRKRCVYTLYLLDSQIAIMCNHRPMLSPLEIKYDLPCVEEAWLARSAHLWAMCQRRQYAENNGQVMAFESPPSQGFFYDASQTLLNSVDEMNLPPKLRLLKASPFSAIVLVMQLQVGPYLVFQCEVSAADMKVTISQIMARELVHASCLLDRSKATKRNCSLLSDTQCRQKLRAMKSIAEMVPSQAFQPSDITSKDTLDLPPEEVPLWHFFRVLWHYTAITSWYPDALLLGGIVESSLPRAVATAHRLAMCNRPPDIDDLEQENYAFHILDYLSVALQGLSKPSLQLPPFLEHPFITLLGFKLGLLGRRLLNESINDIAKEPSPFGLGSRLCHKAIVDYIMSCVDGWPSQSSTARRWSIVAEQQDATSSTEKCETAFVAWLIEALKLRSCWPVGRVAAATLEAGQRST
ncbi:hypothetical protein ABEF95_004731 [Exophiala dermatitidis]